MYVSCARWKRAHSTSRFKTVFVIAISKLLALPVFELVSELQISY